MKKGKIRVGVLLDDYQVEAWARLMLEKVANSDYADVVLVVLNAAGPGNSQAPRRTAVRTASLVVHRVLRAARTFLMERVHCKVDAFSMADSSPLFQGIPELVVEPSRTKFSDFFREEDTAAVRSFDLDVIIRLGFRILKGGILSASRHGVWSYHHGDNRVNRGGPPGFWETMESWPVTGTTLQVLTDELDGGTVLYRSWSCTNDMSVTLNNNSRYWTSASILPRALQRLHAIGDRSFFAEASRKYGQPDIYCRPLFRHPTNRQLLRLLARKVRQKTQANLRRRFYFDQWTLLYSIGRGEPGSLRAFERMVPPRDLFWADPFVVCRDGAYYIFVEEFSYRTRKGCIALIRMDSAGTWRHLGTVIDEPHHLSYPFVFEHRGALYMLAEAADARTVPLYRCEAFPTGWVFVKNLFEGIAAFDATPFEHEGKWYLFAGIQENPGSSTWDELSLFVSDDPVEGAWAPHPMNPVVSDVRTARPAGSIFKRNGCLYRPSQNSSRHYGYGLNINRITKLSESEYEEETVSQIEPLWDKRIKSIHTLSRGDELTVVDAQVRRSRYW
jgi:hypothetical protein